MHALRRMDRGHVAMDVLVDTDEPGDYDAEVHALGAKLIPCTQPTRPWRYGPGFLRLLRHEGPYDIVHSHVGYFSGLVMLLARLGGVPVRVAHSHNTRHGPRDPSAMRRLYERVSSSLIRQHATAGLAVSAAAAVPLFGEDWRQDPRWRVFYLGIDLAPFQNGRGSAALCAELGLPAGAPVIGHVGRFDAQKNHGFLVDVFAQVVQRRPESRLLLVGDGPLREAVEQKTDAAGLREQVVFAGTRSDVPDLLRLVDVFVMPSHHEGLPLVMLEAQAASVPMVVAAHITTETDTVDGLIFRLRLAEPAGRWADAVLDVLDRQARRPADPAAALSAMQASPFNIEISTKQLIRTYEELAR